MTRTTTNSPDTLRLRSYAKINLYLDVRDRRADGFHNIETIFQTVDLWDELSLERRDTLLSLECDNTELGVGPDNLVLRAAEQLRSHAGCTLGATMRLQKRIPIAAGLAGGSGNAAAALTGLNQLWGLGLHGDDLARLGLELGSDVPYCLRGGTAAATSRGEELRTLPPIAPVWFVLVHPPIAVETSWVYQHPDLPRAEPSVGPSQGFNDAIDSLATMQWEAAVFNAMESVVFSRYPELAAIKKELRAAGCVAAAMSGSGPTMFGIAEDETHAREAAAAFPRYTTSIARPVEAGIRVVDA